VEQVELEIACELLGWTKARVRSYLGKPPYSPERIDRAMDDSALLDSGGGSGWVCLTEYKHNHCSNL
jgi:hypothetical protein